MAFWTCPVAQRWIGFYTQVHHSDLPPGPFFDFFECVTLEAFISSDSKDICSHQYQALCSDRTSGFKLQQLVQWLKGLLLILPCFTAKSMANVYVENDFCVLRVPEVRILTTGSVEHECWRKSLSCLSILFGELKTPAPRYVLHR